VITLDDAFAARAEAATATTTTRNRLMHDGLWFTKDEAISRHRGQADTVRQKFNALTATQKRQLMRFLESL
jgi:CxxC motif-containing protein (DUF1111 family)